MMCSLLYSYLLLYGSIALCISLCGGYVITGKQQLENAKVCKVSQLHVHLSTPLITALW